jgi:aldehyde:ferredoxin oxidoreductase
MSYGWIGNLLRVDLTTGDISIEDISSYFPEWIGGRALAARIGYEEIPKNIESLDPDNRIIIATGPLTGTLAPTSGRTIMSGLSPRTYPCAWYTHSTLGGWFGAEMKYAGFDAILVTGKSDSPVYLKIQDDKVQLTDAADLWGLDARQTQLALKDELGQRAQILAIGPAGENLVRFATVQHEEENAAGHSGFGAVWGSKKLKAIVVTGTGSVPVRHPEALLNEVLAPGVPRKSPAVAVLREKTGNPPLRRPVCSHACNFDCSIGNYEQVTDGRLIPAFCIGGIWRQDAFAQATEYTGGGVRVPPSRGFGREQNVDMHELCNSLGLDLWFRLVMQPWLVRCRELGVNEIRGYAIEPENAAWFKNFMCQVANREELGNLFADGLRRVIDEVETELPYELVQLGQELEFNFGFPAHREGRFWDGEPLPFWVISAMMHIGENRDPTIGTHQSCLHMAEFLLADQKLFRKQFRQISETVFGVPDAFEPTYENKAPIAVWAQDQHMIIDSLPLCDFAFPQLVRPMEDRQEWESSADIMGDLDLGCRFLVAVTGIEFTEADLRRAAERAFNIERVMAARGGRGRVWEEKLAPHFELPCASDGTLITGQEFLRLMDEYYTARGWDLKDGWPETDTLRRLSLDVLAAEVESMRNDRR